MSSTTDSSAPAPSFDAERYDGPVAFDFDDGYHYPTVKRPVTATLEVKDSDGNVVSTKTMTYDDEVIDKSKGHLVTHASDDPDHDPDGPAVYYFDPDNQYPPHNERHQERTVDLSTGEVT